MALDYALEGPSWADNNITWTYSTAFSVQFQTEIVEAFNAWSQVANITFTYVQDPDAAEITLGWAEIDGVANILGEAFSWSSGSFLEQADIRFDSSEPWTMSSNGMVAGNSFFEALALHEIGHALGLDHYDGSIAIMNSYLPDNLSTLTSSDIHGAVALYGAPPPQTQLASYSDRQSAFAWSSYKDEIDSRGRVVAETGDRSDAFQWLDYVHHSDAQGRVTAEVVWWDNGASSGYGRDVSDQFEFADQNDAHGRIHTETQQFRVHDGADWLIA